MFVLQQAKTPLVQIYDVSVCFLLHPKDTRTRTETQPNWSQTELTGNNNIIAWHIV